MKKIVLAVICAIGFQSSSIAQETVEMTSSGTATDTTACSSKVKGGLYASFGAAFLGDYKISDKLRMAGAPVMAETIPEFAIGINVSGQQFSVDLEATAGYSDEKNNDTRVRTAVAGFKLRGHYVPYRTQSFFFSGGADLSFIGTQADIFSRSNEIDLNNLDPDTHTGHISLRNGLLYAGPSVAVGLFQNKSFPIRLNLGYEWGLTNGKWESDFADVRNTVKESGHGRAYARITIGL
jgi:hypothetical protein